MPFSFSLSFCYFIIHPARSILIDFLAHLHIFATLPAQLFNIASHIASIPPSSYNWSFNSPLVEFLDHPATISPASGPSQRSVPAQPLLLILCYSLCVRRSWTHKSTSIISHDLRPAAASLGVFFARGRRPSSVLPFIHKAHFNIKKYIYNHKSPK